MREIEDGASLHLAVLTIALAKEVGGWGATVGDASHVHAY